MFLTTDPYYSAGQLLDKTLHGRAAEGGPVSIETGNLST